MHLGLLLAMAADGGADRIAVGPLDGGMTFAQLGVGAARVGTLLASRPGERVAMVDLNSSAVPLVLYGAAVAGKPYVPINYRLPDDRLRALVARTAPAVVVVGPGMAERIGEIDGIHHLTRDELLAASIDEPIPGADLYAGDPDDIAVLLYTSGTTGEPKAAVLRHRNLASYIVSTVEFMGAEEEDCALVSVPSYHVAGVAAVLSSTFSGRRLLYLESFDAAAWVGAARAERVTQAMVVPTMLDRILDAIEADGAGPPPALRSLSYGGGPMPLAVIRRALALLPDVGFVNSYGLTETSSTVAVLGPEEHRKAFASDDPAEAARLASVGRPIPSLDVEIRDADDRPVGPGETGQIWVRGEQVAGEYLGRGSALSDDWFPTRDGGHLDAGGYLFVHGRLDDVIVRGGENISPGEIEETLLSHDDVVEAAVVGIPDRQWGEKIAAAVVLRSGATATVADLQDHVRARLRSTMTPEMVSVRQELPFNETGKLLRRVLRDELAAQSS